ncbi:MAG: hypothetical protein ACOC2K_02640 [Bacteroidota bacterium]
MKGFYGILFGLLLFSFYQLNAEGPFIAQHGMGFTYGGYHSVAHHPVSGYVILASGNTYDDGHRIILVHMDESGDTISTKHFSKNELLDRWPVKMAAAADGSGYYILTTSVIKPSDAI